MKAFLSTLGIAIKDVEKASQNMGSFDTTDKVVSSYSRNTFPSICHGNNFDDIKSFNVIQRSIHEI